MNKRNHSIRKKEGFEGQRAIVLPRKIVHQYCDSDPILLGVHITDIGYYPKAKFHFRERLHGVDQYIIIYCIEGKGWAEIGKAKQTIEPGSVIVVPAGTAHRYAADENDPWTIFWVHFKGHLAKHIVELMITQLKNHIGFIHYNDARIRLFEEVYTTLERGYSMDNLYYANMCFWHFLTSFIFDEKFNYQDKKKAVNVVDVSIDYMQKSLHLILGLEDIAASVNLSASHYSAVFKKKTGFSPIEYFNHLKIQKACQYLQFTDLRIKEIAAELGIEDPYYFSRMFSKLMSLSPNDYRAKRK
jgi:AraC-like DNA-binding protein